MIYFVRHGETQANIDKICGGRTYPAPLTQRGRDQAKHAGDEIKSTHLQINHIICSPLERTRNTAQIIAELINFDSSKIQVDDRINEYDMGNLSGQSENDVQPQEYITSGKTEDPQEFQDRVMDCLQEVKQWPGNTLIVSHDFVGRIIEATKRGLEPKDFYKIEVVPNAQVIRLD